MEIVHPDYRQTGLGDLKETSKKLRAESGLDVVPKNEPA
jgi:hypothetical protein